MEIFDAIRQGGAGNQNKARNGHRSKASLEALPKFIDISENNDSHSQEPRRRLRLKVVNPSKKPVVEEAANNQSVLDYTETSHALSQLALQRAKSEDPTTIDDDLKSSLPEKERPRQPRVTVSPQKPKDLEKEDRLKPSFRSPGFTFGKAGSKKESSTLIGTMKGRVAQTSAAVRMRISAELPHQPTRHPSATSTFYTPDLKSTVSFRTGLPSPPDVCSFSSFKRLCPPSQQRITSP
ncbi:hypothetical protein DFJ73DRAFT_155624 [Zopfochytrium polystomum]|nr:hypothetical protein DFJ73DRAFT_155624 [Zopfochytrium polystomum]